MNTVPLHKKESKTNTTKNRGGDVQPFFSPVVVQKKLEIGEADDYFEIEADRIADKVVAMPDSMSITPPINNPSIGLQRKCAHCEEEERIQRKELSSSITPLIQRSQKTPRPTNITSPEITSKINNNRGSGSLMDTSTKGFMENRFGTDFSGVRIHTDSTAAQLSKSLHAKAFTVGSDIYFNQGKYNPSSQEGKHLLAHELTHTLQQSGNANQIQKEDEEGGVVDTIETISTEVLDSVLPVGNGFYFEINGGITWGYPIYTGGSAVVYVNRINATHMQVIVRKQGRLAFDTGIGGSVMIGRQRSRGSSGNDGIGVGGEAGANFMAGLLGTVIEEFTIPTGEFLPVAALTGIGNALEMTPASLLSVPLQTFLEANAFRYMVHQRMEAGVFAQADAELGAGIRRPSDSFNESQDNRRLGLGLQGGASGWGHNGERNFQGSKPSLTSGDPMAILNFLNLFLSANVNAQIIGGIDQRRNGDTTISSIFLEGQAGVIISVPIPAVATFLASLPPDAGAGVELQITQRPNQSPTFKAIAYLKEGEDQYYTGTAGQQNFEINLSGLLTPDQIYSAMQTGQLPNISFAQLMQAFDKVSFFNRLVLGGQMIRGFGSLIRRQNGVRSLLSSDTLARSRQVYGVNLEAYLEYAADMSGPDFMSVVTKVISAAQGAANTISDAQNFADVYLKLSNYLSGYANSEEFEGLLSEILDTTAVTTAKIRIQVGGGTGISARIAEGAKARGDISVEAGISCELDIAALAGGRITLRSMIPLVEQVIANPIQHIPDCPILRRLFSNGGSGGGSGGTSGSGTISGGVGTSIAGAAEGNRTEGNEGGHGNTSVQNNTNPEQSEAGQGSSANASITQNYPPNTPEIVFPILNVRGVISNATAVGTSLRLRFEIQVPHRNNRIINVPIHVRVVENTSSQIILEVSQTWWHESYRIGSREGSRYTLEKS